MSLYAIYPPKAGAGGVPIYPNLAAFPVTAVTGALGVDASTGNLYEFNGTTWILIGGPSSALALGALDAQAGDARGADLLAGVLSMQSASATFPGLVNNTTQSFSGNKTFTGTIAASNLSGTNTGDVTIGTANGLSLVAQALSLGTASASTTGALTSTDWNTFNNKQVSGNYITALTGDVAAVGPGSVAATIQANVVDNSKLAQMAANTIKGNNTGGSATPIDLTVAQVNTMLGDVLANGTVPFTANQSLGGFNITNSADPTTAQMLATKSYVDAAVAALQPLTSVFAATTANIAGTYANGTAGVGATFTTTATGTFTVDGTTPALGARILIKDQTSGFQNGVYSITTLGIVAVSTVFTRTSDYNTAADMNAAGLIPVINGTVNALSSWQQTAIITTVGTDSLVFQEFTANPSLYLLKANNLSDVGNTGTSFGNISPLTTKGDVLSFSTVNARLAVGSNGQVLTADSAQTLGVKWATPTTGTVTSVALTVPSFLSVAGSPITSSGTLAVTLSGTALPIANGGTGQTTAAAAYNALSPMTTTGDIEYESGTNTAARLAIGSAGNVLTVSGGVPVWAAPATNGTVTSVALTVPGFLSVSGSPITSSGTLAVTLATETANTVFAGPTSGGAATPTFRALTVADQTIAAQAISSTSIDWSTGNMFTKTLGTNTTFTFTGNVSGQTIVVRLTNTASNFTVTWPTVRWSGGSQPTMTVGAFSDVYTFIYDGSNFYGSAVQNMS